ncbi:4-(cytidine 5'-diphospho)-2-C-methyl-D-erythritol kinase [Bartonella sp. F02]|uniref:4-(cytidine 5'-diphospho)-2-C-methyl-D-erythritol kinase n=1 Tax=Bartonella sp. F02 TaxID=2967262 RepID=UPI0022A8D89F|nr:4-(cytidine 5'-diphospho)-2-C-methyl-D-erythritol kinase [Bartonella sp. F02]MCZ2328459.1 4-(cytidine 5'-diphospho)-2-C-methyl-D-erythritol kinase [Bartonella sp. F02]
MTSIVRDSLKGWAYVSTPIKLNLALHVVGQREDGYHRLESLVYFSLSGDCIGHTNCEKDQFIVTGSFSHEISAYEKNNLAVRARDLMCKTFPQRAKPSLLRLVKTLPVASGIGGGSGDAAGVLHVLREQWNLDCSCEKLAEMSLVLGADVPMCFLALEYRQPFFVQGIGNEITRLKDACPLAMVLVNHGQQIITRDIFKSLEKHQYSPLKIDQTALKTVDSLVEFLRETRNDLFAPALKIAPRLNEVLYVLDKSGSLFSRMSGSGATCFGIFKDQEEAQSAACRIKSTYPDWFVKPVMTLGSLS